MDQADYLAAFEKHLLVSSPKREEILAELSTHLGEKGNLGNPRQLAEEENRAHIGWFFDPVRLYFLPVVIMALLAAIKALMQASMILAMAAARDFSEVQSYAGWRTGVSIGVCVGAAIVVGRILPRIQNGNAKLARLGWILLATVLAYHVINIWWLDGEYRNLHYNNIALGALVAQFIVSPFVTAALGSAILVGIALLTSVLTERELEKTPWARSTSVRVEAFLGGGVTLLTFVVVSMLGVDLSPFPSNDPVMSVWMVWWDILFNSSLAPALIAATVALLFARHIKAFRAQRTKPLA